MIGNLIGAADYANTALAGSITGEEFATLRKALTTSEVGVVQPGDTGGPAFRVQALEGVLKTATEKSEKDLVFWTRLAKNPAMSTAIEYSRQEDWGGSGDGGNFFSPEVSDLPEQEATYKRLAAMVKFLTIRKEVSYASTLVNNIVSPQAQKTHEGTMQLLRAAEFAFSYGDSACNELQFDGFLKQISAAATGEFSDIVIDMKGSPPDEDMLEDASRRCAAHFGYLDLMVMGLQAKGDLAKSLFPNQRIAVPGAGDGFYGNPVEGFNAGCSRFEIKESRYIRTFAPLAVSMSGSKTPTKLDAGHAPTAVVAADSTSELEVQTYYYWVSMCNQGHESAAYPVSADVDAVDKKVTVTVADANFLLGSAAATYISIYRSSINAIATATRIASVPRAAAGADTVYVDLNQNRDNCTDAMGFSWEPEVVDCKQLLPLMKMDLAQITNTLPFLLQLFLVPILYVPTKCVRIKNIGRLQRA